MKKLLVVLLLLTTTTSYAQKRIVSVDAFDFSYTGGLMLKHDKSKGPDRDQNEFHFNLNYAQSIEQYEGLMWKGAFNWNRTEVDLGSMDTLESSFGAAGGLLYNFQPNDIKNSFLGGAMFGLEHASYEFDNNNDKSGFNFFFQLEGGKRWDLGQYSVANISYAPTVSLKYKRYGGDLRDDYFTSGYELKLNFLKFDILF